MPPQGRLGDKARAPLCAHGCPACPHPTIGPGVTGSANVLVNSRPALRVDDKGIHAACCGPNQWRAQQGSETVFINGRAAHRLGDATQHCGGRGFLVEGSHNVITGGSTNAGAGRTTQPGWAQDQKAREEALAAADPHAETKAALAKAAKRGTGLVRTNHDHCTTGGRTTVDPG